MARRPAHAVRLAGGGQVLTVNPTAAGRGPKYVVRTGKTPVLGALEARQFLDSIDTGTVVGLRDRALIGLLVFTFARIGAALSMTVAEVYWQHRHLHEKGGKEHAMPCHHHLETCLQDYIEGASLAGDRESPLFRTTVRLTKALTERRMTQSDAWRMLQRRSVRQRGARRRASEKPSMAVWKSFALSTRILTHIQPANL
jgi:site-specific recombinase XerD